MKFGRSVGNTNVFVECGSAVLTQHQGREGTSRLRCSVAVPVFFRRCVWKESVISKGIANFFTGPVRHPGVLFLQACISAPNHVAPHTSVHFSLPMAFSMQYYTSNPTSSLSAVLYASGFYQAKVGQAISCRKPINRRKCDGRGLTGRESCRTRWQPGPVK